MRIFYTHGLGGSLVAQPEVEEVLEPKGHEILRVRVPHHENPADVARMLGTMTFGELCLMLHETANEILARAREFAPDEYAVIGDSLGGMISAVAAERDPRISHCVLLSSSGDICNAILNLDRLVPGLGSLAGMFNLAGNGGIRVQAHKAIAGVSHFQKEFELVNTFAPERLVRLRRLLIVCDRGDPVAPREACLRFARAVPNGRAIFAYDEGRHHPIGKDALRRWVVPFLENRPLTLGDRLRDLIRFIALKSGFDPLSRERP